MKVYADHADKVRGIVRLAKRNQDTSRACTHALQFLNRISGSS